MSKSSHQIESEALNGVRLVVEMQLRDDRFETKLRVNNGQTSQLALESVEGTAKQDWPASGALQEVVPQSGEMGDYLAGVGRCGKSHWSVIVSAVKGQAAIDFDFACRAKAEPDWLGSTYRISGGLSPAVMGDGVASIELAECQLVARSVEFADVLAENDGQVRFAAHSSTAQLPRTVRWHYRFELR